MAVYHRHMTQRVPSDPHWQVNCTAYCGAMLVDDATIGGLVGITGRWIRAHSSEPNPDPNSPGLNIGQVRSVMTGLHVPTEDRTGQNRDDVITALRQDRRVLLQVQYGELGAYRAQAGDFGHALVLFYDPDGGKVWGSDPLASKARLYPEDVMFDAARVFARKTGQATGLRWMTTRAVQRITK